MTKNIFPGHFSNLRCPMRLDTQTSGISLILLPTSDAGSASKYKAKDGGPARLRPLRGNYPGYSFYTASNTGYSLTLD